MRIGVSLPVRELAHDTEGLGEYARAAEALGFSHLRVPDQVIRPDGGPIREPLTLLAYIAGITTRIELVTTILVLPARPTVLVAKQAAEVDLASAGRLRLGIGIGRFAPVYEALGRDFRNRGARCAEQIELLRALWTKETVNFAGRWERVTGLGLNPLPSQRPIPIWYGANRYPKAVVLNRIARLADGWFAICPREAFAGIRMKLDRFAEDNERDPATIGAEAQVAFPDADVGAWLKEVGAWEAEGVGSLALRSPILGADAAAHVAALGRASRLLDGR